MVGLESNPALDSSAGTGLHLNNRQLLVLLSGAGVLPRGNYLILPAC